MNRAEIRTYAKSLVDTTFEDTTYNDWINSGINALSNAVTNGFKTLVSANVVHNLELFETTPVTTGKATIPPYIVQVQEVYIFLDGAYVLIPKIKTPASRNNDRCWYEANDKICVINVTNETLQLYGLCQATPLVSDTDTPEFILAEFHDILSIYAAMMANIKDDEIDRYRALNDIYKTRMNLYMNKMAKLPKTTHNTSLSFKCEGWA